MYPNKPILNVKNNKNLEKGFKRYRSWIWNIV